MSDNVAVPTVDLLLKELKEVTDDWKLFGVSLGVPPWKLNAIQSDDPIGGVENWKLKMFQFWLRKEVAASWKDVAQALVDNNYLQLAATLNLKYLSACDASEDEDKSLPVKCDEIKAEIRATAAVIEKLRDLESSFTEMLTDLLELFTKCKCELSKARFFLDDRLDTDKFSQCTSFDALLRQLRKDLHIDAFNTYFLQRLVAYFQKDELTERIKEYESKRIAFFNDTTVLQFQKAVLSKVEPLLVGKMTKLTIKISEELADKRTLTDIEKTAMKAFEENHRSLVRMHAEPGSVIISWVFPDDQSKIDKFKELARMYAAVLKDAGVQEVAVGGKIVFPSSLEEEIPTSLLKEVYTDFYHDLVEAVSDEHTCQSLLTQLSSSALMSEKKIAQLSSSKVTGSSFLKTLGLEEQPHLLVPLVSAMSQVEQLETLAEKMNIALIPKQGLSDIAQVQELEIKCERLSSKNSDLLKSLQCCQKDLKEYKELAMMRDRVISSMMAASSRRDTDLMETSRLKSVSDIAAQAKGIRTKEKEVQTIVPALPDPSISEKDWHRLVCAMFTGIKLHDGSCLLVSEKIGNILETYSNLPIRFGYEYLPSVIIMYQEIHDAVTVLASDTCGGHPEQLFIKENAENLRSVHRIELNYSPCAACADAIIARYSSNKALPKPAIHFSWVHYYPYSDPHGQDGIECLTKNGFNLQKWETDRMYEYLLEQAPNLALKEDLQQAYYNTRIALFWRDMETQRLIDEAWMKVNNVQRRIIKNQSV